jgi:hypothetical protein
MTAQEKFYALETVVMASWAIVAVGIMLLTGLDLLEHHDADYVFYKRHWLLILITFGMLYAAIYLDRALRLMEFRIWHTIH